MQKDVDLRVTAPGEGRVVLLLAIHWPAALCENMTEQAGPVLMQSWTYT